MLRMFLLLTVTLVVTASSHHPSMEELFDALTLSAKQRVGFQKKIIQQENSAVAVNTSFGEIIGVTDGIVTQFLGVPFAAAPEGDLRWSPPQPPSKWLGEPRNATWWGKACPQNPINFYWGLFTGMGEDCLYLNVYLPAGTPPTGGWPVMVWFYGGGFALGSDSLPFIYDGYNAIASNHSRVMIITVNYRVATMGFLGSSALRALSPDGSVGNWGLQDMEAGLRFAKEVLVQPMGGNPDLITIFGESAGGAAVSLFLTNPRTWGLYQRAIIESGAVAPWISKPFAAAEEKYIQLTRQIGCPANGSESVACMRRVPWENLTALEEGFMDPDYGPVVDGVAISQDPRKAAMSGLLAPGVPVLLGVNRDEGTLFSLGNQNITEAGYQQALVQQFGTELGGLAFAAFPPSRYGSAWNAYCEVKGDVSMVCPSRETARWLVSPSRQGEPAAVYTYLYAHVNSVIGSLLPVLGVAHATDLLNVWNILPDIFLRGEGEKNLSLMFMKMWSNFAWYGSPNGDSTVHSQTSLQLPVWEAYTYTNGTGSDTSLVINITDGKPSGVNTVGLRQYECNFWKLHGY